MAASKKRKPRKPRAVRVTGWMIRDVGDGIYFTTSDVLRRQWELGVCPVVRVTITIEEEGK